MSLVWAGPIRASEISVAAASDLNFAFKEIVAEFEKKTGSTVKLSLGSSGNFFAQLSNGAPFDLFFSADIGYPKKLEEAGLAEPGTLYMYAVGRIVVWVPKGSPIAVAELGIKALQHPSVKKVAIANPKHAPYGRAAVAAMEHYKVHDTVKDKLVLGENISQTAQFIQTGGADIGIIALSLAVAPAMKESGMYGEAMPRKRHAAPTDGPQDVLTAREAAKYLRLALPTFYRYMWQGKIPSSKIGGRYRFKKSLLDRWLGKKAEGEDVSGRNKFVGKVSAIKRDAILAQVNLEVGEHKITAVITRDALDDLGLKVGDTAVALMKATEVMIIKER